MPAVLTEVPNEYPSLSLIRSTHYEALDQWEAEVRLYGRATTATDALVDVLLRVEVFHPDYPLG